MAQHRVPVGRGSSQPQPYYPGIEVVPTERSAQGASPQFYDHGAYPIYLGPDGTASHQGASSVPNLHSPNSDPGAAKPSAAFEQPPQNAQQNNVPPTGYAAYQFSGYNNDKTPPVWQGQAETSVPPTPSPNPKRKRKKLWIWIAVAAVVIIAAVVGGVAGSLLTKHSEHDAQQQPGGGTSSGDQTSSSAPPSSTQSTSISTTGTATATVATMSGTATSMTAYQFPTAVSWGYPHLEVFALREKVYPEWKYKSSTDSAGDSWLPAAQAFTSLGGETAPYQLGIAASARSSTNIDIFVVGTDRALYHKYHETDMEWGPGSVTWEPQSGGLISAPTVSTWAADRLDIWVIGDDYRIYQKYWDETGWNGWYGFDPDYTWTKDAPTVISWGVNRYDIFLVNATDQALYHKFWDGTGWFPADDGWEYLGGYCTSRPVAVSRQQGIIDVFARGGDGGLWHLAFNQYSSDQTWSNWTSLSGGAQIQSEPEAVSWGTNNLEVFAWGGDNTLLHKRYDASANSWTPSVGFEVLGANLTGPPKAISDREEGVHALAYLEGGQLGHKSWDKDAGTWDPAEGLEYIGVL
ncbi:hypothetical protein H2200_002533 [Cladophialophora chaetospira]|uniref:PLL-like beta propeller domain-containing protein n=1 Tax=Cladophialophora chaetospira TaxID=386627 RepID=A0AA38XJ32_9EURO|nr:hypothetical protein H2200_002533 [Cladophialophora chaetospira]